MPYMDTEDEFLLDKPDEELEFGLWLRKRWLQYLIRHNGRVSQNDFARDVLKISNQNLTNYMTNLRRPSGEFVERLADALGPVVYDKLDLPRRMPRDKDILFVVDSMSDFTQQERKELIEHVKNMRDRKNERRKPDRQAASA